MAFDITKTSLGGAPTQSRFDINKTSLSTNKSKRYNDLYSQAGISTLESDLNSLGNLVDNAYAGWQNSATMAETKNKIADIQKRLKLYDEFKNTFRIEGADTSKIAQAYDAVLSDWDALSSRYAKYKNAAEYGKAVKESETAYKNNNKSLRLYDNEIDALEKVWEDYQVAKDGYKWTSNGSSPDAAKQYKAQQDVAEKKLKSLLTKHGYKNLEDAEEAIATLKVNRKAAARYQEAGAIEKPVLEKVDIDIKGTYDSSYDNKDVDSRSLEKAYKYINGKDDSFESNLFLPVYDEDGSRLYTQPAVYYAWMDEKEKKVFNYLFNTGKKEEAKKYLGVLNPFLENRAAEHLFLEHIKGNGFLETVTAIPVGLDQFATGIVNNFKTDDDYIEPSLTAKIGSMAREDLGDSFGGVTYDVLQTISNMAPSILASYATGLVAGPGAASWVGAGTMGASARGNAYAAAINSGMDKTQAHTYSTLVGVSEAALSKALSGISSLGGSLTNKSISAAVSGIENGFWRFAAKMGLKGTSEAIEESLQEILEPLFENIALGYNKNGFEDIDWSEVVYAGLMAFATTGIFETVPTARQTIAESKVFKDAKHNFPDAESQGYLIGEGIDLGGKARELANKLKQNLDDGKTLKGSQIAQLVEANKEAIAKGDTIKIKTAVENRLKELGETSNVPAVADVITKQAVGEDLTRTERKTLADSKYGERVANEANPENVMSGEYASYWAQLIETDIVNAEAYNSAVNNDSDVANLNRLEQRIVETDDADLSLGERMFKQRIVTRLQNQRNFRTKGALAPNKEAAQGENILASPEGEEAVDTKGLGFTAPNEKQIRRPLTYEEQIDEISGRKKTVQMRHILDLAKKLDSKLKVVFVPNNDGRLSGQKGMYDRDSNTMYLANDISTIEGYAEVFKHEFVHRLELKKAYDGLKRYLFNKSVAFEEYAVSRLQLHDGKIRDNRDDAINDLIQMYIDNFKNNKAIPQRIRDNFTREKAKKEAVADFIARTLFKGNTAQLRVALKTDTAALQAVETDLKLFEELARDDRNLLQKVIDAIKDFIASIKGIPQFKTLEEDLNYIEQRLSRVYNSRDIKNTATDSGVVYENAEFFNDEINVKKIALNMTDVERSDILNKKNIVIPFYQGQAENFIKENKDLESQQLGLVKAAITTIAEEFGIIGEKINIKDIDVVITLSKSNLKESVSKDVNPVQLAKLLPILKIAVENAVGIEIHNNRYYFDTDTVYFENLLGGYVDGESLIPVRFGLKHSRSGITTLYVVVDQNKINTNLLGKKTKTEVVKTTESHKVKSSASRSVIYSVPKILEFVNSKDLLRYIPDEMLNEKQKKIKWEAISETIKKTNDKNDKKYAEYISNGNIKAAQQMVYAFAKDNGYTIKAYHGTPNNNITVFDRAKIGSNTDSGIFGRGFYFSTYEETAKVYATEQGKVMPVFLKTNNPWWAVKYRNIKEVAEILGMSESALTMRGYGGKGKIVTPTMSQAGQFTVHLQENGYDSVVVQHGKDNYEIVVFDPTQIKSAETITCDNNGNIIPLSERFNETNEDIRYSSDNLTSTHRDLLDRYEQGEITKEEYLAEMDGLYGQAVEQYGAIEKGEYNETDMPVPQAVAEDKPNERFARTFVGAAKLTPEMANEFEKDVLLGKFTYKIVSDESAMKVAEDTVKSNEGEKSWENLLEGGGFPTKNDIAIGEKLLTDAIAKGDTYNTLKYASELADIFTRAGQVVQAASMLGKMTGAGRLVGAQRFIDSVNKDRQKKYGANVRKIKIDPKLAELLATAEGRRAIEQAYGEIMKDAAAQVEPTFLDKWNTWRYFAMLCNPRTHVRNIIGNAIFFPAVRMKYVIGTGLERAFHVDGTKVVKVKKEYRDFAKRDVQTAATKNFLKGQKYDDKSTFEQNRRTYKSDFLESLTGSVFNALEVEDMFAKNKHYVHALGSYLQAKKIDLNNVSDEVLTKAREYARNEAFKATFNDFNSLANWISKISKDHMAAGVIIEGILPFKRTPLNIIRRSVEYSPIGLATSLTKGFYDLSKGKITADQLIDGVASGVTGSIVFAIGCLFGALGWAGGTDDDEDKSWYERMLGGQDYAIKIGNHSYTVDWAAPSSIPFFIGVELAEAFEDEFSLNALWDSFGNALEPIINLSALSGVQETIESVRYAQGNEILTSALTDAATNYLLQSIPSPLGALGRTIDEKQRTWYVDKNSAVPEGVQEFANNLKTKIPGLSYTMPEKIDAWGREVSRGGLGERIAENFVSPGYYSYKSYTDVEKEIEKLYDSTKLKAVLPSTAGKSFKVNNVEKNLTATEYVTYAKAKGQYSFDYVEEFINHKEYDSLNDEQKVAVIQSLYEYANAKAKTTVSEYDLMKTYKVVTLRERSGGSAVDYYIKNQKKK